MVKKIIREPQMGFRKKKGFREQNEKSNNFFQISPENACFRFEASDTLAHFRLAINFEIWVTFQLTAVPE